MQIEIPQILYNAIKSYCDYNNIEDVEAEIAQTIQLGFNIRRFGIAPFKKAPSPPPIEEEVITTVNKTDEVESLPIMEEIKVEKPQEESKEQEVKPIQPKKRKVRIIKTNTTEKE